ncbi:MAG TPA: hypothetical protein VFJ85_08515 [Acidimicrobiales bacterium]|nr:hypothetical protein [Acidimicrobiales bacterium]
MAEQAKGKTWLFSMFSRESGPNDIIEGTVLNITKWGAVLAAALGAISAGAEKVLNGEHFSPGNWTTMIVALFGLVVLLFIFDMVSRAYASAHASMASAAQAYADAHASLASVVTVKPINASWQEPRGAGHHDGTVDALRVHEGRAQVLVADKNGGGAAWIDFSDLILN